MDKSTPNLKAIAFKLLSSVLGFSICLAIGSFVSTQQSFAEPPASQPAADLKQAQLVDALKNLGGAVKTEGDKPDGAVVEIKFVYTHTKSVAPDGSTVTPYAVTNDLVRQISKLPKVTTLELNMCPQVTDEGLHYLKDMKQLQHLAVPGTITDKGMADLAGLTELQYFRSSSASKITVDGWANIEGWKKLQTLLIAETKIGDKGMEHLKGLTELKEITLWGTPVTDAGAEVLTGLPKLESVRVGGKISKAEVAKLQAQFPKCRFWR